MQFNVVIFMQFHNFTERILKPAEPMISLMFLGMENGCIINFKLVLRYSRFHA